MRRVALILLGILLVALAWWKIQPVPAPPDLGTINGKKIPLQPLLDVYQLQTQEIYHELVLRQLILEQAQRHHLATPASSTSRKAMTQLLGRILVAGLSAERKRLVSLQCQQGTELFELEIILSTPEDKDFVMESLANTPFGDLAESLSNDNNSRVRRGKLGLLSAAEVKSRLGPEALEACRKGKLSTPSSPIKVPEGILFLRVIQRSRGQARDLEEFLLATEAWNQVRSWASTSSVQLPVYRYQETLMAQTLAAYLRALKEDQ